MSTPQKVRLFQPGAAEPRPSSGLPDLDSPEQIERIVDSFYEKVLSDTLLAPLFVDVAQIYLVDY
ncbi:hypothetical protein Q3368_15260, partial [Listeria monocytogenes]